MVDLATNLMIFQGTQNPPGLCSCRFDSDLRHQVNYGKPSASTAGGLFLAYHWRDVLHYDLFWVDGDGEDELGKELPLLLRSGFLD